MIISMASPMLFPFPPIFMHRNTTWNTRWGRSVEGVPAIKASTLAVTHAMRTGVYMLTMGLGCTPKNHRIFVKV